MDAKDELILTWRGRVLFLGQSPADGQNVFLSSASDAADWNYEPEPDEPTIIDRE